MVVFFKTTKKGQAKAHPSSYSKLTSNFFKGCLTAILFFALINENTSIKKKSKVWSFMRACFIDYGEKVFFQFPIKV